MIIAVTPTPASIGIAAPPLLLVARLLKSLTPILAALLLIAGCGRSDQHAEGEPEHGGAEHQEESHADGHAEGHEEGASGRTTIPAATAQSMGVVTSVAGPGRIKEQLSLSGTIQADPARVSRVRARYPGVVREVAVQPWAKVADGALLARVQSNESLQNYALHAPIGGVIVEHRAQIGESTGEDTLFTLIDLSKVWVELDVFQTDLDRVAEGQAVAILDLDGRRLADGRITRIAPLAIHGSQSVRARVVIDNASGNLRPGQFVTGRTVVAEAEVPLLIEQSALQRFQDADVVYEQVGDSYETRTVKLGRADGERVEVLAGLESGARYVISNSYLIKADIEKSGASHDH